jgi:tryptophan synthase alpha chain
VYAVSRTGVTGAGSEVPTEVTELVSRLRSFTELPVCVGFGISKPEHVSRVCSVADGAVIGSWLVDWLSHNWSDGAGRSALVEQVRALKAATR